MKEYKIVYRLKITPFDDFSEWKTYRSIYTIEDERVKIMTKVSAEKSLRALHPNVNALDVMVVEREVTQWEESKLHCPNCGSERITDSIFERKTKNGTQIVEVVRCDRCLEKIMEQVLK